MTAVNTYKICFGAELTRIFVNNHTVVTLSVELWFKIAQMTLKLALGQ